MMAGSDMNRSTLGRFLVIGAMAGLLAACSATPAPNVAQERKACAEVGIVPGEPGFAGCVANLGTAVAMADIVTY